MLLQQLQAWCLDQVMRQRQPTSSHHILGKWYPLVFIVKHPVLSLAPTSNIWAQQRDSFKMSLSTKWIESAINFHEGSKYIILLMKRSHNNWGWWTPSKWCWCMSFRRTLAIQRCSWGVLRVVSCKRNGMIIVQLCTSVVASFSVWCACTSYMLGSEYIVLIPVRFNSPGIVNKASLYYTNNSSPPLD